MVVMSARSGAYAPRLMLSVMLTAAAIALTAGAAASSWASRATSEPASISLVAANAPLRPLRLVGLGSESPSNRPVVLTSDDGGTTWLSRRLPTAGAGARLWQLVLDGKGDTMIGFDGHPTTANRLVRSVDGGRTWKVVKTLTEWYPTLRADPTRPTRIWACLNAPGGGGLWVSNDSGASWAKRSPGRARCWGFGIRPQSETIVASLEMPSPPLTPLKVWRSKDAGLHWQRRPMPLVPFPGSTTPVPTQAWESVMFDPTRLDTAVGVDLRGNVFQSTDAGLTWRLRWNSNQFVTSYGERVERWEEVASPPWVEWNGGRLVSGDFFDAADVRRPAPYHFLASTDHGRTWKMTITCSQPCPNNTREFSTAQPAVRVRGELLLGAGTSSYLLRLSRASTSWRKTPISVTAASG